MVATLREFLVQMTDKNGDMPASYDSQAYFNQLVNELIALNIGGQAGAQRGSVGKGFKNAHPRAQSLNANNYNSMKAAMSTPGGKTGNSQQYGHVHSSKHSQASNASSNGSKKLTGPVLKQVKINKPTFNLQINNNVQSVNNGAEQAVPQNLISAITQHNQNQHNNAINAQKLIELVASASQQQTLQTQGNQKSGTGKVQGRRTCSEDNVN